MAIATRFGGKPPMDEDDFYPSSDGEPMGETDLHILVTMETIQALKLYYADQPRVYVSGDNFIYFQEGNPRKVISPDCYVVFGVEKKLRNSYMTWKEDGKLPSVAIEITSKKTRKEDTHTKHTLYEQVLRVPEYFLFDPTGDYLKPSLQGYRLLGGRYERLLPMDGTLHSEQLNLDLIQEGEMLRLFDPVRSVNLPYTFELAQRAAEAEAEVARLRAELEALRREAK